MFASGDWFTLLRVELVEVCRTIYRLTIPFIYRPPDKSVQLKIIILISKQKHVVGTQENSLNETVLLST